MNKTTDFIAHHIPATKADLAGNNGIGRYIIIPGSDGRAKEIASRFNNLEEKKHPRSHNLFLGTLSCDGIEIDVATISSGIGCPSMEIILHELFQLGGKRFLRVGTAGSLQTKMIKMGDIINTQAAVRDESTSDDYVPKEIPALASYEMIAAIQTAASALNLSKKLHTGMVHCKASFYAREFGAGPRKEENDAYMDLLTRCGVLATEMETAALFTQSQLYNYELQKQDPRARVLAGAILGIISIPPHVFAKPDEQVDTINHISELAIETIKALWQQEKLSG